jgi:hypothetical protein
MIPKFETYEDYLISKQISAKPVGFDVDLADINPMLFDWQQWSLQWLIKLGRGAAFWERGLGKTLLQVEWAKQVHKKTGAPVLIVCPLAVAKQTVREARKIDVEIEQVRNYDDAVLSDCPITIVNFDMFRGKFKPFHWKDGGVVIDESSILKSYTGETKKFVLPFMNEIRYGLLCSATPSPNDFLELGNHAEALGVMDSNQMIANWFMNASMKDKKMVAGNYILKPLGEKDFWRWVTTWASIISTPSDIGGSDEGYIRPPLDIRFHTLDVDHRRAWDMTTKKGQRYLMLPDTPSSTEMWAEKKATYQDRVICAIEEVEKEPSEPHIVWCDLEDESKLLAKELQAIYKNGEVVEVSGRDNLANKEAKLDSFSTGNSRIIITKDSIAGLGLNWQHCARHHFVSINYKWESWYQAVGRTDRFGNARQSVVNMYATETEIGIVKSLKRKGAQHKKMQKRVNEVVAECGLWRIDQKKLTTNLGNTEMVLPHFLNGRMK